MEATRMDIPMDTRVDVARPDSPLLVDASLEAARPDVPKLADAPMEAARPDVPADTPVESTRTDVPVDGRVEAARPDVPVDTSVESARRDVPLLADTTVEAARPDVPSPSVDAQVEAMQLDVSPPPDGSVDVLPSTCLIDSITYATGDANPSNRCQSCQPGMSSTGWSDFATAPGCGPTSIVAGANYTCALVNGGVRCWGFNQKGQLGNNSTTDSHVPVQVVGLESGVQAIAASNDFACALMNGGVRCWGANTYGQLGDNSTIDRHVRPSHRG